MSIATQLGDSGQTSLPGGARVSKSNVNLLALLLLTMAVAAAFGLHLAQAYTGPFEIRQPAGGYGQPDYETGTQDWPRLAKDAAGYTLKVARPSRRTASLYWSIDEYSYSVVPPETVVGVSESAYLRTMSNVHELAERHRPVVAENAEVVLKLEPDLILATSDSGSDLANILRSAGVPIFQMFTMFRTLDEVSRTILLTGYLTGQDIQARAVHDEFVRAMKRAHDRKPAGSPSPRILGFGGRYSYGDETLFHDIVRVVGGINVGAENGLHGYDAVSSELILRWDPDWIIAGADRGKTAAVLARIVNDPAIGLTTAVRKQQVLVLENNVFLPMSPYTTLMLDAVSEALYPGPGGEDRHAD